MMRPTLCLALILLAACKPAPVLDSKAENTAAAKREIKIITQPKCDLPLSVRAPSSVTAVQRSGTIRNLSKKFGEMCRSGRVNSGTFMGFDHLTLQNADGATEAVFYTSDESGKEELYLQYLYEDGNFPSEGDIEIGLDCWVNQSEDCEA